jgi:hypothetical protein
MLTPSPPTGSNAGPRGVLKPDFFAKDYNTNNGRERFAATTAAAALYQILSIK